MGCQDVSLSKLQSAYVVLETTCGTLKVAAAANFVAPAGDMTMSQPREFDPSPEKKNSLDIIDQVAKPKEPGTWTLPFLFRVTGTPGDALVYDALAQMIAPTKTVTGGTSVAYTPAVDYNAASIHMKFDDTVKSMAGCYLTSLKVDAVRDGYLMGTASGIGMQMFWAGTDALNGGVLIAGTALIVDDATKYSVGAYVYNYTKDDSDSGAGYLISAINTTTNTLTIASGIAAAWDDDDVIKGFVPTGTISGNAIAANDGVFQYDSAAFDITSGSININLPVEIKPQWGEDTPTVSVEDQRDITTDINFLMTAAQANKFTASDEGDNVPFLFTWGTGSGDQVEFSFPYTQVGPMDMNVDGAAGTGSLTGCRALGDTAGENSYSMVVK